MTPRQAGRVRVPDHQVVVAGAGPTGLMLAGELALAGIDVVLVERRADQHVDGSRAGGLHSRTIEVLDQRGIADRFLSAGRPMQVQGFAGIQLDISDFPTRHPYGLALWQSRIEPILADWVLGELGVPILRSTEVLGLAQDDAGVDVALSGGAALRAEYLAGCDGGRSVVRKAAGIGFPGTEATTSWLIAEAPMGEEPRTGPLPEGGGIGPVDPSAGAGAYRVVLPERPARPGAGPTLDELRQGLEEAYGTDFKVHDPTWISRFSDVTRQAPAYRSGRVLLAGDAAHVHPPQGGQGLNTGVQDAVNLGWKLAQVASGTSPQSLLDTYHAERHPIGARVLRNTMAQVALGTPGKHHEALRETMARLLTMDEPRRHTAAMLCGLDIHYDLGPGHPLLGRRMPDFDLQTAEGPTRMSELLHDARPVLLDLGSSGGGFDVPPRSGRVRWVQARYDGVWRLPLFEEVAGVPAVLVRPDGHVAWVGGLADPGLPQALGRWFGTAAGEQADAAPASGSMGTGQHDDGNQGGT